MDKIGKEFKTRPRRVLPFMALILSGVLLMVWMKVVSAQETDSSQAYAVPAFSPVVEQNINNHAVQAPIHLDNSENRQDLAPTAGYDLAISKSQLPQTFTVGSNNRYIINVSRVNTETVTSTIIVEDELPAGMSWIPPTTAGKWDCTTSTTTKVNCFYTDSIPETLIAFEPINVVVNVSTNIAPQVTNTAKLINGGSNPANDQATITTNIRSADLEIEKTQKPSPVPSQDTVITYTIVITNNGPSPAFNVLVTDTLPSELNPYQVVTGYPTAGSFDPITNRWDGFNLDKEMTATLVLTTTPKAGSGGKQVTNEARVSSSTHDWNPANNLSTVKFIVGGLEIGKKVSTGNTFAGVPFDYTIIVTNTSSTSIGALVKDAFTTTLDIVSCRIQSVSSSNPCFVSGRTLNTFLSIPANQVYSIIVTARGNKDIGDLPRTITNTASVTWGTPSFTLTSDEVELIIQPGGYAQVGKSNNLSNIFPGQNFTYTISITNTGSLAIASGTLRVTDTLLSNLDFISVNKNGLTMNELVQTATTKSWVLPSRSLAAGEKISFFIRVRAFSGSAGGFVINRAHASGQDIAGRITSSTVLDEDPITVETIGSVDTDKEVTPEQAQVGETLTFKIVLDNNDDVAVTNVRVNDYLPAVLDLTSATTSRGTALLSTSTREVEVNIPTMNPNERTTIVITARVNSTVTAPKSYTNAAYVKWNGQAEFIGDRVSYRVLPSGTLPGTGFIGSRAETGGFILAIGAAAAVLLILGLALLAYSIWARRNQPLRARSFARSGSILIALAVLLGISTLLLAPSTREPQTLSMLAGVKPPVSTSLPVLPVSNNPPTEAASADLPEPTQIDEPDFEITETVELLDLRPTPNPSELVANQPLPTPTLTNGEIDISHMLPTPTPSVLPDYPIPTPTAFASVGPNGSEPDSSAINRIVIPSMSLDAIVKYVPFNGSTWLISGLKQEVAWMGDTSWPGLGGNTGLAGHVDLVTGEKGPFWNLRNLRAGDEVKLYTAQRIYTYRVSEQKVVEDTDLTVIQESTKPRLTLITCTGWNNEVRLYLQRLVVSAELINMQPLSSASN